MTVSVTVAERMAWARRSCDSLVIICAKPLPSLPSKLPAGIRTLSKNSSDVSCALHAELFQVPAAPEAGPVALDNEQRDTFCPGVAVRLGRKHDKVAELAIGNKYLLPLMTKSSPSRTARVLIAFRSLPA